MKKQLYEYQAKAIKKIIEKWQNGVQKLVFQLPTGGGKTLTAVELIAAVSKNNPNRNIVFFVHRQELLQQFKNAYEKQYPDMEVGIVNPNYKYLRLDLNIFVAMIETAYNRIKKNQDYFNDPAVVIIDECHLSHFDKILPYFKNSAILGLSATPTRLGRKNLMKNHYDDIVQVIDIPELIQRGALSPNRTYNYESKINYKNVKKTAGDFNTKDLFNELSKSVHVQNVVKAYEQVSLGKKTLVFNSTIQHSEVVNRAFLDAGYNSRHLDGTTDKNERKEILKWFAKTDDAILHNVGILTAGFDEPSIQTIIMNRPTTSIPLWLQCCGRGSRIYANKEYFTIIDLGGNAERLGDWSHKHDWYSLFHNPVEKKSKKDGVAPVRTCENCQAILPIQQKTCEFCGHTKIAEEAEIDTEEVKLKLFTDNLNENINLYKIDNFVKKRGWKQNSAIHLIKEQFDRELKKQDIKSDYVTDVILSEIGEKWAKKNKVDISETIKILLNSQS